MRCNRFQPVVTRRDLLRQSACGIGGVALSLLLGDLAARVEAAQAVDPLAPKPPHIPARAKRLIFLFMHGGVSQIDTFDPKPTLDRMHAQPLPIANRE